jgi:hypothetical protein
MANMDKITLVNSTLRSKYIDKKKMQKNSFIIVMCSLSPTLICQCHLSKLTGLSKRRLFATGYEIKKIATDEIKIHFNTSDETKSIFWCRFSRNYL